MRLALVQVVDGARIAAENRRGEAMPLTPKDITDRMAARYKPRPMPACKDRMVAVTKRLVG